ncbi:hypothetical protein [Alkalinema sp. FACHB-956]|uniref:hypothetical protein n=1 Tax=Alkalinema sp. FACHB-956 TaxID=2692768 RepID=UPI00168995C3|nr:hypothetical protein [Alkalinema sp. FACHB-956]MBD2330155.1 hypothetical protein [Alkalinema sp. FACHB-956]
MRRNSRPDDDHASSNRAQRSQRRRWIEKRVEKRMDKRLEQRQGKPRSAQPQSAQPSFFQSLFSAKKTQKQALAASSDSTAMTVRSSHAPTLSSPSPGTPEGKPPSRLIRLAIGCGRFLRGLLPWALLLSVGSLVVGAGVISAQFIVQPKSVVWLNRYLPESWQIPVSDWDAPQTLAEIRAEVKQEGHILGEKLALAGKDVLYPVVAETFNCSAKCDRIVELRVYRPAQHPGRSSHDPHYQLMSQIPLAGLEEWFVLEPMANLQMVAHGTSTVLGLDRVEKVEPPNGKSGIWLNAIGEKDAGGNRLKFGRLVQYDPKRGQLQALIPWTSPTGELPYWQQVTGNSQPELIVNQTVGLEPQLQIYQLIQSSQALRLKEIALLKPALQAGDYGDALLLARSGLWSIALERLKAIKQQEPKWPAQAQAQLDLIQRHANLTQAQAKQSSTNPSQQILSQLIDGQWKAAIEVFQAAKDDRESLLENIRLDAGRVWRRVMTAVELDPGNPYAQVWGAVLMDDREGRKSTQKWLQRLGRSATRDRVIAQMVPNLIPATPKPKKQQIATQPNGMLNSIEGNPLTPPADMPPSANSPESADPSPPPF